VVDEVSGRKRLYRLDVKPLEALEAWLLQLHDPWSQRLEALETEVYRTRRQRRGAKSKPGRKSA
jgi:hypothetical protein